MRNLVAIMALLVVLMVGSTTASAEAPLMNGQTSLTQDEFCGAPPPTSISCPKTGLRICECYLSPRQDVAEFSPLDHPQLEELLVKVKPKLLMLLAKTELPRITVITLPTYIERPPQ